ncbi:ectonucleoside triphosphate diphosphohydrolase 3 [Lampris incognitus]|uniref:ectonucleoside triphosphate diphosphohydrolase 3 n=1 Tax=Lampris incognitus TaxID=2546036 RepID=UPI0024B5F6BB|nr:ectonucleoside triphosphate diphosphohydrolase 3 [Lampris incognitus]
MASKCRAVAAGLLFLASIAAIITVAVIQDQWRSNEFGLEYGIVIDSGSSRSNIYLYQWPGYKENETGVVTEMMNCKVSGDGISEMKVDVEKDAASWKAFKRCMDNITKAIPAEKHSNTPLFLGATAGMRLLQQKDEQRSNEILESLRDYLKSLPFMFHNASIISGAEEGLYGWVTVNYIMGNFLEKNVWNAFVRPDGAKTVGSMDLGGASTQIAFEVEEDTRGSNYMQVQLYGYPYNVYTHSFLCYGKNEIEKRVLDKIIKLSPDLTNVDSPCYPEGFNLTIKASSIYDTECTEKPRNYDPNQDITMVGAPDLDKCKEVVNSLFDFKSCSATTCSFNGVEQPPVTGDYMAYAGFFYTARALQLNDTSDSDAFRAGIRKFCHTHWTVLKAEKHWISDRFLKTYCYSAHYVYTLLTEGYKFDRETWKNIDFQKEVKNTSIGWSLGYMLSMSNMIPSEAKEVLPMSNPVFVGLIFLFSALTIVTVVSLFIILIRTCY